MDGAKAPETPCDDQSDKTGNSGPSDENAAWVAGIRARLVDWYATARRALPRRADQDPYRILVSELMLVQTTVTAVIPYFERFLRRFPDVSALASAAEVDVLKAWEGLGYYRRAKQLHAAARQVVREHGGTIPDDAAAIRALPGVGRYIAGAILSFAFDRPEPIVEANSQRVLARLLAVEGSLPDRDDPRAHLASRRAPLVPAEGGGTFNQALMELGALVCSPREPACLICPLSGLCEALPLRTSGSAANRDAQTTAFAGYRIDCDRCPRRARLDRATRTWGFVGAFLGIPDHPSRRGRPGRPVVSAPVDLAEGVERLTGISHTSRPDNEFLQLHCHQPPGQADRAPGERTLWHAHPWTAPGRRPLGRARKADRSHFQFSRTACDRLDQRESRTRGAAVPQHTGERARRLQLRLAIRSACLTEPLE